MKQLYCKECGWELDLNSACPVWCPECNQPLYIREYEDKSPKSIMLPFIKSFEDIAIPIPNYKLIDLPNCCILCQYYDYDTLWCTKYHQETEFNGLCESWLGYEDILP